MSTSTTLLESPKPRHCGIIKSWEHCSATELWTRLLRQFPELAIVKLMLATARPPMDLQGFHVNLRVWRQVIAGLNLPCFAPGSPYSGRTQRAIEWLLLDSAKPMASVAKKRRSA